jgi:hypothetical protein
MHINNHSRIGLGFIGLLTLTLTLARVTAALADQHGDKIQSSQETIPIYLPLVIDQYGLLDRDFDAD